MLGESGDNARSLKIYEQLTVIDPDNASTWIGVGNNLWALGKLEAAAEAYRQAHVAESENWIACNNLVLVLNQLGRTAEAARYAECARQSR